MKYILTIVLLVISMTACNDNDIYEKSGEKTENAADTIKIVDYKIDTVYVETIKDEYYITERLPFWLYETGLLDHLVLLNKYKFDNRLNPMYLEADFNGDQSIDIAIPIEEIKSGKKGIAVIHGKTNSVHILGAGKMYKNGIDDDLNWYNIWFVNRK